MSWLINVQAAQAAKQQAAQTPTVVQQQSYTVTQKDGTRTVVQGPAPSPMPPEPGSPSYIARVINTPPTENNPNPQPSLYVQQGYQANVIKERKTHVQAP